MPSVRRARRSPPPVQPRNNPVLLVVVVVMLLFFVCGLVFLGIAIARHAPQIHRTLNLAAGRQTPSESPETIASKPINWTSNTVTAAEVRVRNREFRERQYVAGYKLRGERDTDADERSLGLVQNWVAANFGGDYDTNLPSLPVLSDQLANDPDCTDPLVLTVTAVNCESLTEADQRLERALKGFAHSKHLGYPKFYAAVVLTDKTEQDRDGRLPELDAQALKYLKESLADGSLQPGDQEDIGEILLDGWGSAFFKRNELSVVSALQSAGKPFKWLALVVEGEHEINAAWSARGSGNADTVTAQGWQGFADHLARAEQCLRPAWAMDPSRPLAPCRMMTVALGNSSLGDMRRWFDYTLAAQVDYAPAWRSMRWGLRPRWLGNTDAMLALGITALNTRRFDTAVPEQLVDSLYDVEAEMDLPTGSHIYGRDDVWPYLQEMYDGYLAQPNGYAANRNSWHEHYGILAYLAEKYDVAGRQMQAINWQPAPREISGWGRDLTLMPLEIAARLSAQSNAVTAAEASRDQNDQNGLAAALKQYQALAADTNLDDRTQSFIQERLASLGLESRLQTHQWVDYLPTDTNFTGWHVERGNCKLNPDGSLSVQSGPTGHLLYSRARIGQDFEVRGEFTVERTSSRSFQAGLVVGLPQISNYYSWYGFRVKRSRAGGDVASVGRHWTRRELLNPAELDNYTNTFYFRLQDGKVSALVNNLNVFKDVTPPQTINVNTNEIMLGIGAYNDANDTVIEYRNVQARLLADPAGFLLTTPGK